MCSSYPPEIVSNKSKTYIPLDEDSVLIRGAAPLTEDDLAFGELKSDFIQKVVKPFPSEAKRLSVSLKGEFKPEYISFSGDPDKYWDHISDINPDSITKKENGRVPVFLLYKNLTLKSVKVYLKNQDKYAAYKISVEWKPLDANFYHYEFRIQNVDTGEFISLNNKGSDMLTVQEEISTQIVYCAIDQFNTIPEELRNK